jgi:tRNA threonylcarbamoyladenosine biosynthesis protein TsaE
MRGMSAQAPPYTFAEFIAADATATQRLGARLGTLLQRGDVVALIGPLGSGKTTFAQGLAVGLDVDRDRHVASPTFALVNEHPGRVPFVHADFYRVKSEAEMAELGLDEAYDRAAAALEWADRFPDALPDDHLAITFTTTPDGGRVLAMRATGPRAAALIAAFSGQTPHPDIDRAGG